MSRSGRTKRGAQQFCKWSGSCAQQYFWHHRLPCRRSPQPLTMRTASQVHSTWYCTAPCKFPSAVGGGCEEIFGVHVEVISISYRRCVCGCCFVPSGIEASSCAACELGQFMGLPTSLSLNSVDLEWRGKWVQHCAHRSVTTMAPAAEWVTDTGACLCLISFGGSAPPGKPTRGRRRHKGQGTGGWGCASAGG